MSGDMFFFKQKTAYEMRISDWSSDVCSSDLPASKSERGRPGSHDPRSPLVRGQERRNAGTTGVGTGIFGPVRVRVQADSTAGRRRRRAASRRGDGGLEAPGDSGQSGRVAATVPPAGRTHLGGQHSNNNSPT